MAKARMSVAALLRWSLVAILACGWLGASSAESDAPSFACRPNGSEVEKAICSDVLLAENDVELNAIYTNMVADTAPGDRQALIDSQREWLQSRDTACLHDASGSDAHARNLCLRRFYAARMDELLSKRSPYRPERAALYQESVQRLQTIDQQSTRVDLGNVQPTLLPGETAFVDDIVMTCGTNSVKLAFGEAVPDPEEGSDADDKRVQQLPVSPRRGILDASFADCRLSDGTSIRVKAGLASQPMAYGECGVDPAEQLSIWVDQRKVVSSLEYAGFCRQPMLDTLSIGKAKADFCLMSDIDFGNLEYSQTEAIKTMKLTHGHCGEIVFAPSSHPDPREFSANGKPLPEPGTFSLEANAPMRAVCKRLLPKEDRGDPNVPDDTSQPYWKETTVKLPQPDLERLGYNATTLSANGSIHSAVFDLENTGKSATVYMQDSSNHWFDGTALANAGKGILVMPFDAHDDDASLAKGIHVWVYDHASVFFDHAKTYILLDPINDAYDPKVIVLHGKMQETVCTFHRAQENF